MNRTQLPQPPDPGAGVYTNNDRAWRADVYKWMLKVKSQIEADSTANTTPIGPFVVDTFTAVSTVTGTDDLSNLVATLITAMNGKGITAPNISRTS